MQVILLKDVQGVGKTNDVLDVNDGYAKNFLVAKRLAVVATQQVVSRLQNEAKQRAEHEERERQRMEGAAHDLDKRTFSFAVKVGGQGKVFGSVSEREVAEKIGEKLGFAVDKKHVKLPKSMKQLGEYIAEVKLGSVTAHPKIVLTSK